MKTMYFGNKERMAWVKCPAIDADVSSVGWSTSGGYLNGGNYVRNSATAGKVYQFKWNLSSADDIHSVVDFANGVYGQGPYYFLDPFAIDTNLLPTYWAAPRLAALDAPSLVRDKRPSLVNTASNSLAYPTKSAVYTLVSGDVFNSLNIPIPEGYVLHLGVHGSATGTAAINVTGYTLGLGGFGSGGFGSGAFGGTVTNYSPALLSVTTTQRTNYTLSNATGATISVTGVGQLTLSGLVVQIRPAGQVVPSGGFISGRGHSGCDFDGMPSINGYSSALDLQGATAKLIEVAAWL